MILLLLVLDVLDGVVLQLSPLFEDFRGLSERGGLRKSLRCCLASEALIESGMHLDLPEIDTPLSVESDGLQDGLQVLFEYVFWHKKLNDYKMLWQKQKLQFCKEKREREHKIINNYCS